MSRNLDNVSDDELVSLALKLVNFYHFTFFSERDCDEKTAFSFIRDFIFILLGLHNENEPVDETDLMHEFVSRLNTVAEANNIKDWQFVKPCIEL
jgi:hypothetical protein